MALLTKSQHKLVNDLVRMHHYALIVELLGEDAVDPGVVKSLKKAGLYRKPRPDALAKAFKFGKAGIVEPKVLTMSSRQFETYAERVKLDEDDQEALDIVRRSFGGYLEMLGDDYQKDVNRALLKADKSAQRALSRRQKRNVILEVERRKALASVAKDLSAATEKQLSNAVRTVSTETNNAYQDGRAQEIIRKSGTSDPFVFKRPRHDACDECRDAYLEDDKVTPVVFKLSELVGNGTNVGKSRGARLPVLESFHPHCACETQWLPPGFGFDANGRLDYVGKASA